METLELLNYQSVTGEASTGGLTDKRNILTSEGNTLELRAISLE